MSDSIALCWATCSAFYALLSSHVMTNKDDIFTYKRLLLPCLNADF